MPLQQAKVSCLLAPLFCAFRVDRSRNAGREFAVFVLLRRSDRAGRAQLQHIFWPSRHRDLGNGGNYLLYRCISAQLKIQDTILEMISNQLVVMKSDQGRLLPNARHNDGKHYGQQPHRSTVYYTAHTA